MTPFRAQILCSLLCSVVLSGFAHAAQPPIPSRPKLVVMLVIDQFRADYLTRFATRFEAATGKEGRVGGFRYLMEKGAYYPLAEYDVLQSMTCVGHATVLSGSYPYLNGIAINDWFDRARGKPEYCVGDSSHHIVGIPTDGKNEGGTSPKNFHASTVGDELKNAGGGSKVVAVALKDRAAILMGGHRADLALWFDAKTAQWISSTFYLPPPAELPVWVKKLNATLASHLGVEMTWKLGAEPATGLSLSEDTKDLEGYGQIGGKFPHHAKIGTKGAMMLPYGIDKTTEAAIHAVDAMKLGQGKSTDLLAVSYSSHDMVGHVFGPNSREIEEYTVLEDRSIADLINHLRKTVPGGLANVTIVLTADHGIPPVPEYLTNDRVEAGRIDEKALRKKLNAQLVEKFGKASSGEWIPDSGDLNFYLNGPAIAAKGVARREIENEVKTALLKLPEIDFAFTATDYAERHLPPGMHERQILHTYIPDRSGDVVAIPKPYFVVYPSGTTHHTGYSYDRYVPLVLAGHGIRPGRFATHAGVIDIAPTLSFILGLIPPNMSEGRVLGEALIGTP